MTHGRFTLPLMTWLDDDEDELSPRRKVRSADTWRRIRKAWEAGETGQSLARRYDVGLANLWRRRASENWSRMREEEPFPEPAEGWTRYAKQKLMAFQLQAAETRALAQQLSEAMAGGDLAGTPLWHLGFVLHWRAERLGPEIVAQDREWIAQRGHDLKLWDEDGRLLHPELIDELVLSANRDAWREDHGIPPGVCMQVP